MRRPMWMRRALAVAGLVCLPLAGSVAAQSTSATPIKVEVRQRDIQALPFYVGLRSMPAPLTAEVSVAEVGTENLCGRLGATSQAVLASALDVLRCPRTDIVDAFNYYRRAPVQMVADVPDGTTDLSALVVSRGTSNWLLAALLSDTVRRRAGAPRLVGGGEGEGAAATYRAGVVDGVLATAPLPEYLSFSRGRVVWDAATDPAVPAIPAGSLYVTSTLSPEVRDELVRIVRRGTEVLAGGTPEDLVELVGADFPLWEPDRLLAAVRSAQAVLNPDGRLSRQALLDTAKRIGVPLTEEAATQRGATAD